MSAEKWSESSARNMITDAIEEVNEKHGVKAVSRENWADFDRRTAQAWKQKDMALMKISCAAFLEVSDETARNTKGPRLSSRGGAEKKDSRNSPTGTLDESKAEKKTGIASIFKATENGLVKHQKNGDE